MENSGKLRKRDELDVKYKWNIEAMYADDEPWEADMKEAAALAEGFSEFSGRLAESAETLLAALRRRDEIWQKAERVYVYAHMKSDEDNTNAHYQELSRRAQSLLAQVSAATSFFTPELMEADADTLTGFLESSSELGTYRYVIEEMLRQKEHVLSKESEMLMARLAEITSAPQQIFGMINNADIRFGTVRDENGEDVEVTHVNYISLMESSDRRVRREAYEKLYDAYTAQKNTIAAAYFYNVRKDAVVSEIRNYGSSLLAELDGDFVPESVYRNLIDVVNKHLDTLHRYVGIRKKMLGLDEIHMYDIYASLVEVPDREVKYEEALDIVRRALRPLGEQYISDLNEGLKEGWVDVYGNEGKTAGAYSFGSYDSMPYVLLNYNDKFKDVFTVIHELGHSMNSLYTRRTQPFVYGGHSIFTAEVASTVNECLLIRDLLAHCEDKNEKAYLINTYIEEFRATVFRQTMFAEFELQAHELVEAGEILTPEKLCGIYGDLNKKYFGPDVVYDDRIAMEWARIPHFYNSFYVYKYATGYSAAAAISSGILNGGEAERDAYLEFLAAGDSDHPIELLKRAGADMSTPAVVESAMEMFEGLIDQLEELVNGE